MEILYGLAVLVSIVIGIMRVASRPSIRKFAALGDLRGKTLQQIISGVGLPSSYSSSGTGRLLVQWIRPGMHIALAFEYRGTTGSDWGNIDAHQTEYVCLGVTHQYGG